MSDLQITVSGKKRLLTGGKFCDKNIVITAAGGEAAAPVLQEKSVTLTENITVTITPDSGFDGLNKAVVTVNVPTHGSGSACTGKHILEVAALPTENIDKTAVYLCDGAYYKYAKEFTDFILVVDGLAISYVELATAQGATISLNIIPTKTTDGILVSGESGLHLYYIEDEAKKDVYVYGGEAYGWKSFEENGNFGTYKGIIADKSEATEGGYYALMEQGWTKYLAPTDTLEITEGGAYKIDVTDVRDLFINVPDAVVFGTWRFRDTVAQPPVSASFYINFTCGDSSYQQLGLTFKADGTVDMRYYFDASSGVCDVAMRQGVWEDEKWKTVDFGTDGQLVTSEFKQWLIANADPAFTLTVSQ